MPAIEKFDRRLSVRLLGGGGGVSRVWGVVNPSPSTPLNRPNLSPLLVSKAFRADLWAEGHQSHPAQQDPGIKTLSPHHQQRQTVHMQLHSIKFNRVRPLNI